MYHRKPPAPYEFRPVSPTFKEVPPSSFDPNKVIKPSLVVPIPLSQPETVAVQALLQLRQSQSVNPYVSIRPLLF